MVNCLPGFGDRKAMLGDIAILTGGQVISEEVGLKLENVDLDVLGLARKVVVTKDETTIVDGAGTRTRSLAGSTRSAPRSTANSATPAGDSEHGNPSGRRVTACGRPRRGNTTPGHWAAP